MQKSEVVAALREMADLLEITDAGPFEIMAFRNGAQSLDDWFGDLDEAVASQTLTEIPAIGKGLSRVITELVQSDACEELTRIRGLVPPGLPQLLRVRGLGPKRIRTLWRELAIECGDDLRHAAAEGRIQALKGFGAKTVENFLAGLDYLERETPRTPRGPSLKSDLMPQAPGAAGKLWAGTSGFSYPQWKGTFYPADAQAADFLELYAAKLTTVEINNTFYRFPTPDVIGGWKSRTPADFRFALKANRRITHLARLGPTARESITQFVERSGQLGSRLGCILFQLPPDLIRDDARLELLLSSLPAGPRYAVEFRHASWHDEAVLKRLREHNVACVSGDAEGQPPRQFVTADFVYLRLRKPSYTAAELDLWDRWFQEQLAAKRDVLAYLKHDDTGAAPQTVVARWSAAAATQTRKRTSPSGATSSRQRRPGKAG